MYPLVLYPVSNFKAIGQLLMDIFHIKDLWNTKCHLAANAVVQVRGKCQISIATYLRGGGGKVVLQCIGN